MQKNLPRLKTSLRFQKKVTFSLQFGKRIAFNFHL